MNPKLEPLSRHGIRKHSTLTSSMHIHLKRLLCKTTNAEKDKWEQLYSRLYYRLNRHVVFLWKDHGCNHWRPANFFHIPWKLQIIYDARIFRNDYQNYEYWFRFLHIIQDLKIWGIFWDMVYIQIQHLPVFCKITTSLSTTVQQIIQKKTL